MRRLQLAKRRLSLTALASAVLIVGTGAVVMDPDDLMLHLDLLSPDTGRAAEIVPGVPWIRPGPDGEFETNDDIIVPSELGDVDLVLRAGISSFSGAIPDPSAALGLAPVAIAEPFGLGTEVEFVVTASDGAAPSPYGNAVTSPSLEGAPIIVAAFADLDGDGFVGITHLDGDLLDFAIEEAEFTPVGVRVAIAAAGRASGSLRIRAGGPQEAPLRVVLTAAAYAGPTDPAFFGGNVPDGPAVLTQFPFLPRLDPDRVIEAGPAGPGPADPLESPAVEIEADLEPDPGDPRIGESFTLRTDGSEPTVDIAVMQSGEPVRFGLAQVPDAASYLSLPQRPLRPGVGSSGETLVLEILQRLLVADDGDASEVHARVVALDRLGNVADPESGASVVLSTRGIAAIVSPDADGDPFRETVFVADARGVEIVLDDVGGVFDGPDQDVLLIEGPDSLSRVELLLPDPDTNDDGIVGLIDCISVWLGRGPRLDDDEDDDGEFDPRFDLDGNGEVDRADFFLLVDSYGRSASIP